MISPEELYPKLESLGEKPVRERLAQGVWGQDKIPLTEGWLAQKEREAAEAADQRQEFREVEALAIAREANSISHRSNRISWFALGVAVLGFLLSLVAYCGSKQ